MTHPALIERITRSLAYMLRHQPEKFGLHLDAHGFGELGEVVAALSDKLGEPIEARDLEEAIAAGDRPRYEIRGTTVRALYGHSIEVEPGDPSQPPEFLYVGIDSRDAARAAQFGLRGGRRRFLHLALNIEDAREAGRRAGREYAIVRIYALDAWEDGVNFYDRRALFLAEQIPTQFLEVLETHYDGYEPQPAMHDDRGSSRFEHGGRRDHGHGRGGGDRRPERGPGRRDDRRGEREFQPRRAPAEFAAPRAEEGSFARPEQHGEPVRAERHEPAPAGRHERGGHRGGDFVPRHGGDAHPRGERAAEDRPNGDRPGGDRPSFDRPAGDRPREHGRSDGGRPGGGRHERGGPREERHERFERGPRRDDGPQREHRAPHAVSTPAAEPRRESPPSAPARSTQSSSSDSFGEGIFDSSAPARPAPKPAPPAAPPPPPARPKPDDELSDFGAGI